MLLYECLPNDFSCKVITFQDCTYLAGTSPPAPSLFGSSSLLAPCCGGIRPTSNSPRSTSSPPNSALAPRRCSMLGVGLSALGSTISGMSPSVISGRFTLRLLRVILLLLLLIPSVGCYVIRHRSVYFGVYYTLILSQGLLFAFQVRMLELGIPNLRIWAV